MTIAHLLGSFNILVGFMLVLGLLLWGAGCIMWVTRLGTFSTYRDDAIRVMEWSVSILFVLIVLSVIVKLVVNNIETALFFFGVLVVIVVILFALSVYAPPHKAAKEEDH